MSAGPAHLLHAHWLEQRKSYNQPAKTGKAALMSRGEFSKQLQRTTLRTVVEAAGVPHPVVAAAAAVEVHRVRACEVGG